MGHALIEEAVISEWTDLNENSTRPKWMRQQQLKPCTCKGKCVFCKNGLTGPHGPPLAASTRRTPRTPNTPRAPRTPQTPAASVPTPSTTSSACSTPSANHRLQVVPTCPPVHTKPGEDRVNLGKNSKNCGVCMLLGRKAIPKGTKRSAQNEHLYIAKVTAGCPHPMCNMHPVCKKCWPWFNNDNHQGWCNIRAW